MSSKRPSYAENRSRFLVFVSAVVIGATTIVATGCGGDLAGPDLNPGFMAGDWLADSLVMTSVLDSTVTADPLELGATFTPLVEPSGRYTAILEGFGQSSSEIGDLTVDGAEVVLMPASPPGPESRALWDQVGDSVILMGDSDYDFNLDGTTEPATLRQMLVPK